MNAITALDPKELGRRLRIARTAAQLTQECAAKAVGMARTTLVAIERGDRKISAEELVGLCRAFAVEPGRILRGDTIHVDLAVQFRSAVAHDDQEALAVLPLLQNLASRYVELEKQLGRLLQPAYPPVCRLHNGNLDEQAEDLARELRGHLGIGNSPIPDVLALIEAELRLRLLIVPLAAGISGAYTWHEVLGACILINANHAKTRQNWTAAHELGHFMTNRDSVEVLAENPLNHSREDRFANLFAEAFLMPSSTVRRRYWDIFEEHGKFSTRSLMYLATTFHVSAIAMSMRLEKLNLISKGTTEMLKQRGIFQSIAKTTLREQDPNVSNLSCLPRYTMVALEAYEKQLVSEGELAKMLRLGRIETRELLDCLEICEAESEDAIGA